MGASGVVCSPGSSPSRSQRRIVCSETPSSLAACWMVTARCLGPVAGRPGCRRVADAFDAWLGEREAGAGAASLAGEDLGDLTVGVVFGEATDQLDRVLAERGGGRGRGR